MARPRTRYARTRDGLSIAYQVLGEGPVDLLLYWGLFGSVEAVWDVECTAQYLAALAGMSRLLLYDSRGTGLSDHPQGPLTLESSVEDALAVMDAVGASRVVLQGSMQRGAAAALMAAQHPDLTESFVWYLPTPRHRWAPDYPWGEKPGRRSLEDAAAEMDWGGEVPVRAYYERDNPSLIGNEALVGQLAGLMRHQTTPKMALEVSRLIWEIDVRPVLPAIRVPTLVIDRDGATPEEGAYTASRIPRARRVVLEGRDCLEFLGDWRSVVGAITQFLGIPERTIRRDRRLSTVLFTDIVESTSRAFDAGDASWLELLERHDTATRRELARFGGVEVKTTGDGFLATFDGPARAVRCAQSVCEAVKTLGLHVRAGCHTGEIETQGADVGGVAVHVGARVAALAGPSEVLVSSTVKDLVAGSGLTFEDRGEHRLKGVPQQVRLYRLVC